MKGLHSIAFLLTVVGGLNWGLIAIGSYIGGNFNVVNLLLGSWSSVETLVYLLIGLSTLSVVLSHKGSCTMCCNQSKV
ncbi:MAG: DUF378 domain-containing protein [Minisyncoccia bacterium]